MSKKLAKGMWIKRILGICLMIFSLLGLVISILGLPAVSRVSKQFTNSTDDALALTLTALDTTDQSLALVHDALGEARDALGAAQTVVEGVDGGLQNTGTMIDSVSDTLTGDLSQVIWNTQDSVAAAGKGAAMIEDVLYDLSAISLLVGITYAPDVSLTESFDNINTSLDSVPQTLAEMSESLSATQESLHGMQAGFADLTDVLDESKATLTEAQTNVDDYRSLVGELSLQINNLQENLPGWIRRAIFSLYFLLIWLAISQVGLLWQGWEMVRYRHVQVEERVRELEKQIETALQKAQE
jgi:uncharacterized phage infection (PIP) family protein YhgE